jgi:hypothetical protein
VAFSIYYQSHRDRARLFLAWNTIIYIFVVCLFDFIEPHLRREDTVNLGITCGNMLLISNCFPDIDHIIPPRF